MKELIGRREAIGAVLGAGAAILAGGEVFSAEKPKRRELRQDAELAHLRATAQVAYRLAVDSNLFIAQTQGYSIGYEQFVNFMDKAILKVETEGVDPLQPEFWTTINEPKPAIESTPTSNVATAIPSQTPRPSMTPER